MNYWQKFIAVAVPATLLSAPAYAHGGGMALIFIGLPFLGVMFIFFLIGALSAAPKGKRFGTFLKSLFIGALWVAIFIWPCTFYPIDSFIMEYEITWSFVIPIALFIGSQILRKGFRKNNARVR